MLYRHDSVKEKKNLFFWLFLQSQRVNKDSSHELVQLGGLLGELHHHGLVEELVRAHIITHPLQNNPTSATHTHTQWQPEEGELKKDGTFLRLVFTMNSRARC